MRVKLVYYKQSGKYYTSASYQTKLEDLSDIWAEVRLLIKNNEAPGLTRLDPKYNFEFITSVSVPSHPHNHPKLIIPDHMRMDQHKCEVGL